MKKIFSSLLLLTLLLTACTSTAAVDETTIDNPNQVTSQQKNIIGTIETNGNLAYEPTPENLLEDSVSVVRIKFNELSSSEFIDGTGLKDIPVTKLNVESIETLSGKEVLIDDSIYILGGTVSVKELVDYLPAEKIEKMELNTLSRAEQSENYMVYTTDFDVELEKNNTYILILKQEQNGNYIVDLNGYSIFKVDMSDTKSISDNIGINMITNNEFDF